MFKFYILAVILCTVSADFIFRDLYSNQDEFITYPDHWTSSGAEHSTSCTQLMLGLFGEGSSLTFVHWTIPEHNTIDFRVKVLYVEAWDGESLQFDISNKTHKTTLFSGNVTAGNSGTTSCGYPIKTDGVSTIYGSVSHTGSYLSIRFSSPRLIGKAASWGISEFSITARNASNSPDNSICNTGSPSLTITGTCQCPDGQYRSSNGDCAPCHEACTSCYGPEATHCFACNYWHSDYAKCQCPAPRRLVQNHCYLDCDDGKFLDRDQCVDSCPPIRSLEVGKECRRNCGDHVYANQYGGCAGSCTPDSWVIDKDCVDSCPSYMYQIDATDVQGYCVLACPSPKVRSGDKCIDSCPSPKLASNGECVDTCPSEQFAYNGTCVSYCPFPKVQVLDLCLNFCPFGMTTADHPKKEYAKRCLNSTGGLTPEPGTCIPPKFRHQGQCYDSCPDGFTADTGTYTCFCNTPPKFSYQNKCLDSCPPGLSPDYSSFSYYTCKCFSPKYSHEGQCLDECPPGTTPDTSFSSTYTCKAASGTTCSPPKVYYNGQCLDTCPTGTTPDTSSTPYTCTTSSGSTCIPPKFSYQDQCLDGCPTGTKTNTNSYTCQDFILRDLYSDSFINYPYNWDSPQVLTLDDTCGSEKLIGGSMFSTGQYVDFVYTDLPDHTVIQFRVKVWFIDTWNGDTVLFDVLSNTKKVTLSPGNMKSVSSGTNVCGGSSKPDGSAIIHGNIDHTGSYLLIRMYSSLYNIGPSITGTSTFSWGIREFSVVARTSAQSYSGDSCNIANPLNLALNGSCTCPNGQYPTSNGGCGTCHAACSSCYGPGSTDCFTCNPSHANYAECMCPSPLKLSEGKCIQACPTGQLDYQDQCVGNCPATTVASNGQCVSSCSSSQVSYQGQCLAKCPSSKLAYKGGCVDFCPSGTYEYEGTCVISCPYFTVKVQNKCANSCPSPKVAYIDTCVDSCPKGFLNKDRCVAQCPPTKVQVLTYCVNSCPDGMTADSSKICLNSNGGATPLDGTCAPPKFFYKNQCLNSCPSQTSADYDAYTCQGDFILRDLYSNPLISYPENWVSPQFETLPTTECGSGNSLIGGYNKFGEGAYLDFIYFNLPVHTRIEFRAKIWYIDAWNKNYVQFIVSSEVSTTETSKVTVFPGKMTAVSGGTNVCGSTTSSDGYAIIYGSVAHTGSYLSIRAVSNVYSPATSLSWGIREFSVVSRTPPTPYSGNTCNIANPPSLAISTSASCTCPDGQYKTSSGTCSPCHEACLSCYGSAATQCFTCNPSYPGYEECMCPAPLKLSQGKCVLTCPAGKFVHNGQCVSSCPERYISSGDQCVRNCTYPQLFEETILSYVCKDKCVSPKLEYNRECVDFCPSHTYRNEGKCVLACPFPKVKSGFGTDGKCVDACPPSKFTSVDECVDTCPQGEFPYNGKCMSHCSPPKVQLLKTCIDSCPPQMTFLSHPEVPGAGYCMNSTGGGNPCPPGVTVDPTTYTCSCPAPKFSYQGQCLDSCPTGTTSDTTTTPYTCKTSSGSTCSPPKFSHQGQCLDTCPTGTTSDTTTTPYTCKTCSPPKFFHQSQCLDTCPTGTTPDTTTTPYTCKTGSGSTCSPPKFSHQGQCLDNCPTGTTADTTAYTCTAASSDCIPNCAVCDGQKCKICKTGFKKFDDTTCYPVCPAGKKLTSAGVCEEPTYQYQTPSCIDKLKQGLDDQTCKLSNGLQAVYEVTYNPSTHYFSQKQDGVTMTCSDNQQTRKLSASGSYLATLTMIAKRAGVSTLNSFSLTSAQDIGTKISPLVTDRCDFAPVLPTKLTGFPFYLLGVFPLMTQGADFSAIAAAQLSQIYSKTLVDRAIGNLVACGQSCSAILVWKHTNANKPITSHATMLVKLTTTTAAGTMDQIFKNAQVAFADPAANNSAKREKSTLCYDEGGLRYCASELIIYKKKSA